VTSDQEPKRGKKRLAGAALTLVTVAAVFLARGVVQSATDSSGPRTSPSDFTLRGSVRSLEGQPIPGARVMLYAIDESHAFTALGEHAVAGDASFAAPVVSPAFLGEGEHLFLVRASAPGYASESRTFEANGEGLERVGGELRLELRLAGHPASVAVSVEAAPELPSAGARVLLTFEPLAAPRGALYAWRARTDEAGAARFDDLPQLPGTLHVWAEDEHGRVFRKVAKPEGALTTEVKLAIERGLSARVQLVPTEAGDLTGAELTLREADGPWRVRARPDAAGKIELRGVPAGIELIAEVSGSWILADGAPARPWRIERAPVRADVANLAASAPTVDELSLRVSPGGAIWGVTVDEQGRPIRAATVTATPERQAAGVPRRVTTDQHGRFALSGLSLATAWTMEARHPEHAPARATAIDARTRDLRLQLSRGGALIGRVVDGKGRGVAGVEVYAHAMKHQAAGENRTAAEALPEYASILTDEEGRYRLGRVNPGTYRFEVRPTARMQWANVAAIVREHEVKPGDNALPDLTISRGAQLIGKVEPIAAAAHVVETLEVAILPAGEEGVPHRVAVHPDHQGRFTVDELSPGSYRVQVRSKGRGWSEPAQVALREGDGAEAAFRFTATARLEGKIAFSDGAIPRNARIDLYRERGAERPAHDLSGNWAMVAEDGRFAVTGLAAGSYTARIGSDDAAPHLTTVELKGERTARTFTVERGADVQVALRAPDGDASKLAGKIVMLEPTSGSGVPMQAVSDASGVASFAKVPTGAYRARAVIAGMPSVSFHSRDRRAELTID
jgi:Carboxypeptidase regulatory-like domain